MGGGGCGRGIGWFGRLVGVDEDPGWPLSWKTIPSVLLLPLTVHRAGRDTGSDPLVLLRKVFIVFCVSIAGVTVVVLVLGDVSEGREPVAVSVGVVGGYGIVSLFAPRLINRPLDCSSGPALVVSYRTRFFLGAAVANAAAMVGLVISTSLGPWWVYFVGAGFTVIGLARIAPSRGHLEADELELRSAGCSLSLIRSLRVPLSESPGSG